MVTQTIQFESISLSEVGSGAITAFLYDDATLAGTLASIAENGTLAGRYTGTVEDVAAGTYRLVVKVNDITVNDADEMVDLLLAVGTYVAYQHAALDTASRNALLIAMVQNDTGETAAVDGSVAKLAQADISGALAGVVGGLTLSEGTIVGFPSTLQIGDAYTVSAASAIAVYMRDLNNDPITSVGSHSIDDVDFAPTLVVRAASQIVKATLTLIDPGGGGEKYLRVEFPSSQTIRASQGTAKMQCVLSWGTDHRTVATQEVEWLPRL